MPTLGRSQLPPPKDWGEFEDICRDVWARIWGNPYAERNCRQGQPQAGVDVYGRRFSDAAYEGIQCKGKDTVLNKPLTAKEVRDAVNAAKQFEPPLSNFIIATLAPKDGKLQRLARLISASNEKAGGFAVSIVWWEEIQGHLCDVDNRDLRRKHWPDFAVPDAGDGTEPASEEAVEAYLTSFATGQSAGLDKLVATCLRRSGAVVGHQELVEQLHQREPVHLHGPSGSGKSHLARHLVIDLCRQGFVPIVVKAQLYSGELSPLLERSVGVVTSTSAKSVVTACDANGRQLLLVVDGLNEATPPQSRESLLDELIAFRRRHRVTMLLTNRGEASCAEQLKGPVFDLDFLTASEKQLLLGESELPAQVTELLRTPLDVKVAKEAAASLGAVEPTPFSLLNAFARRRLKDGQSLGFQILTELAWLMNERLSSAVREEELLRLIERFALREADAVLNSLRSSGLVVAAQGYSSFWHERLQRFFQAEALLRKFPDTDHLLAELKRPRNEECIELVVSGIEDLEKRRACVKAVRSDAALLSLFLGEHGAAAQAVMEAASKNVVVKAGEELGSLSLETQRDPELGLIRVTPVSTTQWSKEEVRLQRIVGQAFVRGRFCEEVLTLVERTDRRCRELVQDSDERTAWNALFLDLYLGIGPRSVAVSRIMQSFRSTREGWTGETRLSVAPLLKTLDTASPGLMLVLVHYFQDLIWHPVDGGLPRVFLSFLRSCWETGLYHLRSEAAELAGYAEHRVTEPMRSELVGLLESWLGEDAFLNTTIAESLSTYGDLGVVTEDAVRAEIRASLAEPRSENLCRLAAACFSKQFEDIYQNRYYEAIVALEGQERAEFHLRAALGMHEGAFFLTSVLRALIELASPHTRLAFERWLNPPAASGCVSDDLAGVFLLAHVGLAKVSDRPPELRLTDQPDTDAWKIWGQILFWLHRSELEAAGIRERWSAYWQQLSGSLLLASVDPWYQIEHYARSRSWSKTPYRSISEAFPAEARKLLESALPRLSELTGIFPKWSREADGRARFVISELGRLGNEATLLALRPFVDAEVGGSEATVAIREIQDRLQGRVRG